MRSIWLLSGCLFAILALPAQADTRTKITTVSAEYTPLKSSFSEPVSVAGYHFEVNADASRARVVVDYEYRDQWAHMQDNESAGDPGLEPGLVQLPGLTWDPTARAVVYEAQGKRTLCAVQGKPGKEHELKNTGACTVTATASIVDLDDGWEVHHAKALDIWLNAH